jgi:hypothetical protein
MVDNMRQIDRLLQREYSAEEKVSSLKDALRHHRFHGALQRRNLVARIAAAEKAYNALYAQLLKLGESAPYSLYQKQLATRKNGITVTVELSLDGLSFSNPAPPVPNHAHVWVRAKIEENHTGAFGIPKSHELLHVTWVYSPLYTRRDHIGSAGRDEFFVSNPLILTREFIAPASGSTKHDFFVYVDTYERFGT